MNRWIPSRVKIALEHGAACSAANVIGWLAVLVLTGLASFWAFWGIQEAFHEGWCQPTLRLRLLQVLVYLSPTLALTSLAVISLRFRRTGAVLFILVGATILGLIVGTSARFHWLVTAFLTAFPIGIGGMFLIGEPQPKRSAFLVLTCLPLAIVISFGAGPIWRVATRYDDGDRGLRTVPGNGVTLQWAPAGPGWTRDGLVGWDDAMQIVGYLDDSGTSVTSHEHNIWRLPTREEIVRSLTRDNRNAGGTWDPIEQQAEYQHRPDKESPLWDPHASLIYLWTSEQATADRAWIVVYHGDVVSKPKAVGSPSFGFRAVRDATEK